MNIEELSKLSQEEILTTLDSLDNDEKQALFYNWQFWARHNQLPPEGDWNYWLLLAGRGFGKTRVGAEWVRMIAETAYTGRIVLVAPTNGDIRETMVEGESGIMAISPPWFRPKYEPSKKRLTWPNGVIASLFSAEEPDRLRGPQCGAFWADEAASWDHQEETWSNLMFGFRLGKKPRGVITTTPRPVPLVKRLIGMGEGRCHVTKGTTYENRSNLAEDFYRAVITEYEGTRLGRQELNGELLEDNPNSMFKPRDIDQARYSHIPNDLDRIVVAVDPAVTANAASDETGIVVVGEKMIEGIKHFFVIDDRSEEMAAPEKWSRTVANAYFKHKADRVIAESNNGGDMVISNIRISFPEIPVDKVIASRGKTKRAEPVSSLYEQGRVHHCGPAENYAVLEDQMVSWDPTLGDNQPSPDRMDALVWGISWLMAGVGGLMKQGRAV